MSVPEIVYRLRNKAHAVAESRGMGLAGKPPAPDMSKEGKVWMIGTQAVESNCYITAANSVIEGAFRIFSLENARFGKAPVWNRDPRTGVEAPMTFGKTLNYRDESVVGDIKYLWEPNRHLQLVWLCQAYALGHDETYLSGFRLQLESWFEQCPYPSGPNWTSSLELGIRLINWSICWQLIGGQSSPVFYGDDGQQFLRKWMESVYQHSYFIASHWSRYSSANNHLIGEAAGLYIATATWPLWDKSTSWRQKAYRILSEEALRQNAEDGVNLEQAVSYQQFVLDFLIMSGLAARATGFDFSPSYWGRIEKMLEYLASIMDLEGNVPMIGDADDGYVVSLSAQSDFSPYRSLLATGAVLFNRPSFLKKAGGYDDKTQWLLGDAPVIDGNAGKNGDALPVSQEFPSGGYYILGCDFETHREVRCIVDCGPLGYTSIAAHGHADALSFVLSVGGVEFLIDPGTYAYHTLKEWRGYFRGTGAHNTIRVDGMDQSEPGGNFMWLRKANVRCDKWENEVNGQVITASHDGYKRLTDPVIHKREIEFHPDRRQFLISDHLECKSVHRVERMWHFSEDCDVVLSGYEINVKNREKTIKVVLDPAAEGSISIYKGSDDPVFGWVSRRFDCKIPAMTVVETMPISGASMLSAVIECND